MSGIAKVAHDQDMVVSGSDLKASRYTSQLQDAGISVFIGHGESNIPEDCDTVVVSTAILENNKELQEAKDRNIPIIHRAEMLARLGEGLKTLAVAGTHGKTTTSSMLASTLDALGLDPTFLIGGIVRQYGTNAHSGSGEYYVVEADESDKSFLHLQPQGAIITNIEADHLDHYKDEEDIFGNFKQFIDKIPEDGVIVACADDARLMECARGAKAKVVSYGLSEDADYRASDCEPSGIGTSFKIHLPDGSVVDSAITKSPGLHNVANGTAVVALLHELGIDAQDAANALREFAGVKRRFDYVGEAAGVTVVDDYAHHPTEIAATIKAARQLGFDRVHVVFQPHRYSRLPLFTEVLRDDFAHAFDEADIATFMNVYPAGEMPIPGVSGKSFLEVVESEGNVPKTNYIPRRFDTSTVVAKMSKPGDLIITMGAGDVTDVGPHIVDILEQGIEA